MVSNFVLPIFFHYFLLFTTSTRRAFFTVSILFQCMNAPWLRLSVSLSVSQHVGWSCRGRDPEISHSISRQHSASSSVIQSCDLKGNDSQKAPAVNVTARVNAHTHTHTHINTKPTPNESSPTAYPSIPAAKHWRGYSDETPQHRHTEDFLKSYLTMKRLGIHLTTHFFRLQSYTNTLG